MRTALITGSSKGIGYQIAKDFLAKGYYVITNSRKMQYDLPENQLHLCGDLSSHKGCMSLCSKVKDLDTKLDSIVLSVGVTDRTPFGNIKYSNWGKVIDTNLNLPFFLVQQLKECIKRNGSIIFISSVLGSLPRSRSISYGVSKGALEPLIKYLAVEFTYNNITVNGVAPGFINTDWHKGKTKKILNSIKYSIPMGRFGSTKEISSTVMFLANNRYITGQMITVDGGYSLA